MAVAHNRCLARGWMPPFLMLAVLLLPAAARGSDQPASFEITWASISVDYSTEAAWGFWNSSKYNGWQTPDEEESQLAEVRFIMPGDSSTAFLAIERLPTLRATGIWADPEQAEQHLLTGKVVAYDLAFGQWFRTGSGSGIFPWIGGTSIRIEETRSAVVGEDLVLLRPADRAKSTLWGAVAGVDAELSISRRLSASGRVLVRWAKGNRKGVLQLDDTGSGEPTVSTVKTSDSTTRAMWGAEIGLCWLANNSFSFEGGWRYRDWQYDDGPATFDGPFLRLIVNL